MALKNFVIAALALAIISTSSIGFAQQRNQMRPEERANNELAWMSQNMTLTADQSGKVHDILLHYAQEAEKFKGMPPGPEKRTVRMEMQKSRDAELKGALTGDQYEKYHAHMEEMRARMQERRGRPQD